MHHAAPRTPLRPRPTRTAFPTALLATALLAALLAVALVAPSDATAGGQSPTGPAVTAAIGSRLPAVAPHRAIVEFRTGTSKTGMRRAAARQDGRLVREIPRAGTGSRRRLAVVTSTTLSTAQLVASLEDDPRVVYAEPDYLLRVDGITPDDPFFASLWGLTRAHVPAAWGITTGSADVVVADIDTGVDYTHPDLTANMWRNPEEIAGNGIDDDGNGYVDDIYGIDACNGDADPFDDNGHGTHTSGTIAAAGDNGVGVTGVGWRTRIMALKFLAASGYGYSSDAVTCLNYVIDQKVNHGVNVVAVNNSWGGGPYNQALCDAIEAAGDAGIVSVMSAGNNGKSTDSSPQYPACYLSDYIISVAALDETDQLAWFSNWGMTTVDIAAPGTSVLSTVPAATDPSGYASWSGTSMAAPHVSGAVALCAAAFPDETAAQRIRRVFGNAEIVPSLAYKCVTGGTLDMTTMLVGDPPPFDDDIPGRALPASPHTDLLALGADAEDVYALGLQSGQTLTARAVGDGTLDVDLYLFPPGTATVRDHNGFIARAGRDLDPDEIEFKIETTGTYYLDASCYSGSGGYTLTYDISEAPPVPDTTPPVSSIGGVPGSWSAADVTATLSATDDTDPSPVVRYAVDGGAWTQYVAPIVVSREGTTTVSYRSADAAGNLEVVRTATVRIDRTAPTTTLSGIPSGWTRAATGVTLTATDGAGSGVARTEYRIGSGSWSTYGGPVTVSSEGETVFSYRAIDKAGNVSAVGSATLRIDKTGSATRALRKISVRRGRKAVFRFRVDDRTATAKVVIKIFKGRKLKKQLTAVGWKATDSAQSYTWRRCTFKRGTYIWKVYATDEAGNAQKTMVSKRLVVK